MSHLAGHFAGVVVAMHLKPSSAPQHQPTTSDEWITAMGPRLSHLENADEATVWAAIPGLFPEVVGKPCDQGSAYDIALAAAVVRAVRSEQSG